MPGPTTEAINDDLKSLKDAVHAVDVRLGKVETKVSALVGGISLLVVAALASFYAASRWAGGVDVKLDQLAASAVKLDSKVERSQGDILSIRGDMLAIQARLDASNRAIADLAKTIDRLDSKLDRLGEKVDQLPKPAVAAE